MQIISAGLEKRSETNAENVRENEALRGDARIPNTIGMLNANPG